MKGLFQMALSNAERNRRYRARLRGEKVPLGKPGRKPTSEYFRAEFPEEWLAPLLNLDPQRLRDFESSVASRGMSLADYVQMKRELLPYGQQPADATDETDGAPLDPLTQAILNFDFGDAE